MNREQLYQAYIEAQDKVAKLVFKRAYHPVSMKKSKNEALSAWKNYQDAVDLEKKANKEQND